MSITGHVKLRSHAFCDGFYVGNHSHVILVTCPLRVLSRGAPPSPTATATVAALSSRIAGPRHEPQIQPYDLPDHFDPDSGHRQHPITHQPGPADTAATSPLLRFHELNMTTGRAVCS